jgi:pyrimidine deaminase RibD-like protein
LSKNNSRKKKRPKQISQGPNKVKYEHFLRAIELSKECKPEPDKEGEPFPRVGVVVVKKGKIISEAFRGEIGVGQHAEYIALEKKAGGKSNVQDADLITTLEPCTTRSHDKRPCVSWIKSRNIRKVWIATLDYNPRISGRGEQELRKEGILVGRFPDDLAPIVLQNNKEFFDMIQKKQPQIVTEEQKRERSIIIENLKESLQSNHQKLDLAFNKALTPQGSEKKDREWKRLIDELNSRRSLLLNALDFAIAVEINTVGSWVHLGDSLLVARMLGSALLAYRVATEIDATNKWAWEGLVQTEPKLSKNDSYWPRYFSMKEFDSSPSSIHSRTWMKFAERENNRSMKIRMATRAIQNGGDIDSVWHFIKEVGQASMEFHQDVEKKFSEMSGREKNQYREEGEREVEAWIILGELFESIGEKSKSKICTKMREGVFG